MERGPILSVLKDMIGTPAELDMALKGDHEPIELRNVVAVEQLHSSHGIRITTKSNTIWLDASHVSAMWQARMDLD
ncbi:MAG: hypothetical protein QGG74_00915 [Phycisphaerales bacterium]|jgi:hypothetical protein|nr:hypothetical protein [Phycisphaerales bacterium]